jgi:carbon-monoxide dehydrogenase large subunit
VISATTFVADLMLKAGFWRSRRISAANVGAWSCYPVTCGVEPLMALAELPGPYDFRQYKIRSRGVTTTPVRWAPYRGVSRPAITLSLRDG